MTKNGDRTMSDMPWFKFFGGTYFPFVKVASTEVAGAVFKAVCCYVCEKPEDMPELLDPLAQALFQSIRHDIDGSFDSYLKQVEAGKSGGRPPKPRVTHLNPSEQKKK